MGYSFYDIKNTDLDGFIPLMPSELAKDNHRFIGAIDEDEYACGILVWHSNHGYIQIDHVAVDPELVGEGIARGMVDYLLEKLENIGEHTPVVAVYTDTPEYENFDEFIRSITDFEVADSGRFHIINQTARQASVYYQSLKQKSFHTEEFTKISPLTRKKFYYHLEKSGIGFFKQEDEASLVGELSKCTLKDGEVSAVVLVSLNNLNELEVALVYCRPEHGKDLGICLTEAIKAADSLYPERNIVFNAENEQSINLSRKLFGENIEDVTVCTAVSFGKIEI